MILYLAACEERPDVPSAAQNAQLDEAEAMLDEAAGRGEVADHAQTQEGPDAEAPDPPEN